MNILWGLLDGKSEHRNENLTRDYSSSGEWVRFIRWCTGVGPGLLFRVGGGFLVDARGRDEGRGGILVGCCGLSGSGNASYFFWRCSHLSGVIRCG